MRRTILTAALLAATAASEELDPNAFRLEARTLAWEDLDGRTFDPSWLLPDAPTEGQPDLEARMRRLVALEIGWAEEDGARRVLRLGDLVLATRDLDGVSQRAYLDELFARSPEVAREWGRELRELLQDARLFTHKWKPSKDFDDDGICFGDAWNVHEDPRSTWTGKADPKVEQAATLFRADLVAIKRAESDYRLYPRNVGADYEEIRPIEGSLVTGQDPEGRPFSAYRIYFRCDLPFPFSDYESELSILTRTNARGELVTDIYSPSRDFYYMGGRDTFLPVETAAGEWVGYLAVRRFGFDLDGVPDGVEHRREAMRGSLGNLRRNAERFFGEWGGERRCRPEELPPPQVLGERAD